MATYCLSSTILPVVQRLNCPVVVLNLQPTPAIDYERLNALGDRGRMTGMWLANCQAWLGARNRQRAGAQPPAVRLRDGMARRSGRLAADRRVDRRCGRLCRYASEPARRTGTLLRGDARRIYRPHAPVGRLRDARRTARNVRAARPARGGDRRGGRGQDRGVPARLSRCRPNASRRELERAARTSVALDRLVARTGWGRWPIITRVLRATTTSGSSPP